jgi:hypothetical protein
MHMRAIILALALLAPSLRAQGPAPRFMYIYRDSLKRGVDSAYRIIENDGAQICADLRCPNPYLALESLSGPHEAWWLNVFATEADTASRKPTPPIMRTRWPSTRWNNGRPR